ncbi:hypothetical protein AABB24_023984, partial [Solanum stoloniferum]
KPYSTSSSSPPLSSTLSPSPRFSDEREPASRRDKQHQQLAAPAENVQQIRLAAAPARCSRRHRPLPPLSLSFVLPSLLLSFSGKKPAEATSSSNRRTPASSSKQPANCRRGEQRQLRPTATSARANFDQ